MHIIGTSYWHYISINLVVMTSNYRQKIGIILFVCALSVPFVYILAQNLDWSNIKDISFKYYCLLSIVIGYLARVIYKGKLFL